MICAPKLEVYLHSDCISADVQKRELSRRTVVKVLILTSLISNLLGEENLRHDGLTVRLLVFSSIRASTTDSLETLGYLYQCLSLSQILSLTREPLDLGFKHRFFSL